MKLNSAFIIFGLVVASQSPTAMAQKGAEKQRPKDVILKTRKVIGTFTGFETGDYVHALIKSKAEGKISAFIQGYGLDYFLAVNAKKTGEFTVQTVKTYIREAGGMIEIDRVTSAKFGKTNFATWWKATKKAMSEEKIEKKFEPLVQKLTKRS